MGADVVCTGAVGTSAVQYSEATTSTDNIQVGKFNKNVLHVWYVICHCPYSITEPYSRALLARDQQQGQLSDQSVPDRYGEPRRL